MVILRIHRDTYPSVTVVRSWIGISMNSQDDHKSVTPDGLHSASAALKCDSSPAEGSHVEPTTAGQGGAFRAAKAAADASGGRGP